MLREWYEASVICGEMSAAASCLRETITVRQTSNYWRRKKFVVATGTPASPMSPMLPVALLLLLLLRSATDDVRRAFKTSL